MTRCPFCAIAAGLTTATIVHTWDDAIVFTPLEPVIPDHLLIVPRLHFERPDDDPDAFGALATRAAQFTRVGRFDHNLALNAGPLAGQTVRHVHFHLLPRRPGDDVRMPWDACPCTAA